MSEPAVVLLGAPGSGKTVVGRALALRLGLPMHDGTQAVEALLGQPVAEFLASGDEDAYAAAEEQAALTTIERGGVVVLSSGAVRSPAVRKRLSGLTVVWLRANSTTITRRLSLAVLGLPLQLQIRRRLDLQLAQRAPLYEEVATGIVDTDRLDPEQVSTAVIDLMRRSA